MAPSTAQPISKCYTAGSCRLDVSFTLSALSQWAARPIVDAVTFQLWLEDTVADAAVSEGGQRILLAEGDRTQLQAIAQYFQAQTRRVLALATFPSPANGPNRTAVNSEPAQVPPGLTLNQPLGYLQLCDVTSVLAQYEQATKALPVSLQESLQASSLQEASLPAQQQPPQAIVPDSDDRQSDDRQRDDNVIPLDLSTVRRVVPGAPSDSDNFSPDSARRSGRRNARRNVGRNFFAGRDRRKTGMWASSAAAALFVVGLTTTLISRDPTLQDLSVTPDAPTFETQPEAARSGGTGLSGSAFPESAAEADLENALEGERATRNLPAADTEPSAAADAQSPSRSQASIAQAESAAAQTESSVTGDANRPQSETPEAAGAPEPVEAAGVPGSVDEVAEGSESEALESEALDSEVLEAEAFEAEVFETDILGDDQAFSAAPERAEVAGRSDAPPASNAAGVERESADVEVAGSGVEGGPDSENSPNRSAVTRQIPEQLATESATAEEPLQTAPLPPPLAAPQPAPVGPPPAAPERAAAPVPDVLASRPPSSQTSLDVGLQIQSYFQRRWQSGDLQSDELGPLSYTLQLSESGEVNEFVALDERSGSYRDRLFSADNPPTFNVGATAGSSAFRVVFNPNGVVEVAPL